MKRLMQFLKPSNNIMRSVLTILISVILISTHSLSQPFEGKIIMSITYLDLPPELEAMSSMLPSKSIIYVKSNHARTEQSMGMIGTQVIITDSKSDNITLLYSLMGQKYAIPVTRDGLMESQGNKKPKITYLQGTKNILGFSCKKAEVKFDERSEPVVVFYTEDIAGSHNCNFFGLKGFPLEYKVMQNDLSVKMMAKEIKREKISSTWFETPTDYKKTTMSEMEKMLIGN